jgi:hypothetical protein
LGVRGRKWRRLHNEELHNLYSSPNIVRFMKSREVRWTGHTARMAKMRIAYQIFVGKSERKNSRDSSVGIALGYGLDDRGSMVRFQAGAGNFSLHHRVKNGSGAHPASYPTGTGA